MLRDIVFGVLDFFDDVARAYADDRKRRADRRIK